MSITNLVYMWRVGVCLARTWGSKNGLCRLTCTGGEGMMKLGCLLYELCSLFLKTTDSVMRI